MNHKTFSRLFGLILLLVISFAFSLGQNNWVRYVNNPVVPAGVGQTYSRVFDPSVLYNDSTGSYQMWFTTDFGISYATSPDGKAWTFNAGNPVLTPSLGEIDIRGPHVIRDTAGYKMYYSSQGHYDSSDPGADFVICLATSADGVHWTKYAGNPVLAMVPSTWEAGDVLYPEAYYNGTSYYLWYTGFGSNLYSGGSANIGLATSTDGYHWTRYPANPVLTPELTGWESGNITAPEVVVARGKFYMFYYGVPSPCCNSKAGFAVSTDGIHWQKSANNPVLTPAGSGWESVSLGGMSAIFHNDIFEIWYGGLPAYGTWMWQIGYASSSFDDFVSSSSEFTTTIHFQDPGPASATLTYGARGGAHAGIDTVFGEEELPPVPPAGTFDARWEIDGSNGTVINFQDTLPSLDGINRYLGTVQPGPAGYPITISWNRATFPRGSFVLEDHASHGNSYKVDMDATSEFVVEESTSLPFEVQYDLRSFSSDSVVLGWNMASSPVTVSDRSWQAVFAGAAGTPWGFDGHSYVAADSIQVGLGYWVKFNQPGVLAIHGSPVLVDTIRLSQGWNMIGSAFNVVSTAAIQTIPPELTLSKIYGYDNGYYSASSIFPVRAYWVKSSGDGAIVLSSSVGKSSKSGLSDGGDSGLNELVVSDASGRAKQTLYFGELSPNLKLSSLAYAAPPQPPTGAFDVRFAGNSFAAALSASAQPVGLQISNAKYPVEIRWKLRAHDNSSYGLIDGLSGKLVAQFTTEIGSMKASRDQASKLYLVMTDRKSSSEPSGYRVDQNFPNPFNPMTTISFVLAHNTHVSIRVYNIMGQEVATLVDADLAKGDHVARWDAVSVPSGMYWYRLTTPDFSMSHTMSLIK